MSDTIQIQRADARKAYEQADTKLKPVLETLFGKDAIKPLPVTERIRTVDDILAFKGYTAASFNALCKAGELTSDEIGYRLFKWGAEAYNEGWVPDFSNGSQPKYTIWMEYKDGSGFSFISFGLEYRYSTVGSRLCFKDAATGKAFALTFKDVINKFFL